jgi:hypothetical protein
MYPVEEVGSQSLANQAFRRILLLIGSNIAFSNDKMYKPCALLGMTDQFKFEEPVELSLYAQVI